MLDVVVKCSLRLRQMAAGAIPKPQMRRLLERNIGRALVGAVIFSAASGVAWYLGVSQPRKQRYADFYK